MNDQCAWKLQGTIAQLNTKQIQASLDVEHPEVGVTSITSRLDGRQVNFDTAQLLGVHSGQAAADSLEPTDYYARGDDMVVTCRMHETPDVGLQIYWRVVADPSARAAGIEAIVSAQTELLDSDPTSTISSLLPPGDVLTSAEGQRSLQVLNLKGDAPASSDGVVLVRFEDAEASYLEMVHPTDNRGATIRMADAHLVTSYPVLTERLEKGVIRRSRLQAMFLPRDNDIESALELYRRFASSPLPLTT